jgi:hypothetical protein
MSNPSPLMMMLFWPGKMGQREGEKNKNAKTKKQKKQKTFNSRKHQHRQQ